MKVITSTPRSSQPSLRASYPTRHVWLRTLKAVARLRVMGFIVVASTGPITIAEMVVSVDGLSEEWG